MGIVLSSDDQKVELGDSIAKMRHGLQQRGIVFWRANVTYRSDQARIEWDA